MADEGSLGQAYAEVSLQSGAFNKGLLTTQASMKSWHGNVMKYAKVAIGITGVAMVIKKLRDSVNVFADYDKNLRNVWTLTNMTWGEMQKVGEEVERLGLRFGKTGSEGLQALYQIYSAGHKGADGIKVLEAALIGAQAGLTSVETWADVVTTVVNAFGKSAADAGYVTDVLFKIVERGKVTGEELASTFGTLAAIAAPMGVSFEEVAGALMTLTRRGIGADQGVTSLTQAIMQLARPTEVTQKIIEELGYSSGVAMVQTLGFADALAQVTAVADRYNLELTELFTNKRAVLAVLPLAGNAAAEYAEDIQAAADATGAAVVAAKKQRGEAHEMQVANARMVKSWKGVGESLVWVIDLINTLALIFNYLIAKPLALLIKGFSQLADVIYWPFQQVARGIDWFIGLFHAAEDVNEELPEMNREVTALAAAFKLLGEDIATATGELERMALSATEIAKLAPVLGTSLTFGTGPRAEQPLTFGGRAGELPYFPDRTFGVPSPPDIVVVEAWTDAFETLQDAMAEDPTTALSALQGFFDTFGEMPAAFLAGRGAAQSLLGDLEDLSGKFEVGAGITWLEDFLGITAERAEKAAEEQKRLDEAAARKAASDAAQAQRQAEQDARNSARAMLGAFEDSFLTPALQALGTGDWLAAAAGVQSMAVGFPELLAAAEKVNEALRATGQEEMTHLDVLRLLTRAEGDLVSALEDRIRLAELAADWDLAAALRSQLEEIEKMGEAPVAALTGREKIGAWLAKGWDRMIGAAIGLLPSGVGRIAGGIVDAFTAALDPKDMGDVADMLSSAVGVVIAVFDLISSGLERKREELLAQIDLYINAFSRAGTMLSGFVRGFSTGGPLSEVFQAGMQAVISTVQMMTLEGAELIAAGIGMMFDLVTSLVGAITGLIKQSDAYQALQEESSSIWKAIADLLGEFLWPLAAALRYLREWLGIQDDVNEGAKELAASLNVPLGWKAERIRYAASIAGQAPIVADGGDQIEIPEWAEPFGRALAEAIMKLLEGYGITGWGDLLASIREKAAGLWTWITGKLPEIMGAVESAIDQVCEFLDRHGLNIEGIIERVKDGIQWFIDKGPGFISDALGFFDRLVVAAEGLKDWIFDNLPTWDELEGAIDRWMKELADIGDFTDLRSDLRGIETAIDRLRAGLIMAIGIGAGAIVGAQIAAAPWAFIGAAIGGLLGGLGGGIMNKIISGSFDRGGVVPGPLGMSRLISAEGGETLLPTHQPDFMAKLAELSQPLTVNVFVDGKRAATATLRALGEMNILDTGHGLVPVGGMG